MRILVELPEKHIRALDRLASRDKVSRAALIRAAVAELLDRRQDAEEADAFGLWAGQRGDGLAYQQKMRDEW